MSQLRQLHLLGGLTGGIPSELGRLRNLESLGLENNDLAGNIPASLGQVDSLRAIAVDNNPKMSGNPAARAHQPVKSRLAFGNRYPTLQAIG